MIAGISIWKLLVILGIIVLIFGTKKLRNIGGDLGGAVKGFKSAMDDDGKEKDAPQARVEHDAKPSPTHDDQPEHSEQHDSRK